MFNHETWSLQNVCKLYEFKKYSEIIQSYESFPGQLTLIDLNMDYEKKKQWR